MSLWLDRTLISHQCLALCLMASQFKAILRKLDLPTPYEYGWLGNSKAGWGATHTFKNEGTGDLVTVVCINPIRHKKNDIELMNTCCHEAAHVWQDYRQSIGEGNPSPEFEAYAVANIASKLYAQYKRMIKEIPSGRSKA
jgi:hypothetical protein